jgi:glycosyltransferase involved in cell wall biosynthesis
VQFCGYVLPAELKEYYLRASVFVMSSLWPEPFGMAGPEAMRYGLPVVAFDAGGIREWLHDGQNGYLIPWKDTNLFAARLDALLGNKDLARKLGQGALAWVKNYDGSQQIDILERLFQRVLHHPGPQAPMPVQSEKILSAYA